jgi:tRNA threonylcarbamoyladenosine biosynthesis protein TsaE
VNADGEVVHASHTETETERLGERLGPALRPGDVVVLTGPLGAGKTRFVRGLARGMGSAAHVRSPSFVLILTYPGPVPLTHLDLYRLERAEVDGLGIEESLEESALVVEWGERLPHTYLADALTLRIETVSADERRLHGSAAGARGAVLLDAWRGVYGGEVRT